MNSLYGLASLAAQFVALVGGGTIAGYAFFQWLGKRWLETRFAKNFEQFKHEQSQEIEKLRYRINALMDRTTKLHQHEFEVLPEVWDKLGIAASHVMNFTSRIQFSPDLDSMGENQFADFLENCELRGWQKVQLRESRERNSEYKKLIFWHQLDRVKSAHAVFHNLLISKGIFIQPDLKERIRSFSNMMYDAFHEIELDHSDPSYGPDRFEKGDLLRKEAPAALKAIEENVQARLWEANRLD